MRQDHERLDAEGALAWPCSAPDAAGQAKLYIVTGCPGYRVTAVRISQAG
jgi:hypothetical protein